MKTVSYTIPTFYLPAIFNADYSELEKADVGALNNFLAAEGLSFIDPFDCPEDVGFMRHHDLASYKVPACNCSKVLFTKD